MKYGFQKQSFFLILGCPVFKSLALVVVQFRYFWFKDPPPYVDGKYVGGRSLRRR